MQFKIFYFVLILLLSSCSAQQEFEGHMDDIGIKLSEPFKIDSIKSFGFTDWTLSANIQISETDEKMIIKKWKENIRDTINLENRNFPDRFDLKTSKEKFKKEGSQYYYRFWGKFKEGLGDQTYEFQLDTINNKFFFIYGSE